MLYLENRVKNQQNFSNTSKREKNYRSRLQKHGFSFNSIPNPFKNAIGKMKNLEISLFFDIQFVTYYFSSKMVKKKTAKHEDFLNFLRNI